MMYETFPRMASLHIQTATGPTECQDLLGMEFRTAHFDGMAHVPSYTDWVVDCDMRPAYRYHRASSSCCSGTARRNLWHLKTPVHMLSLGALRPPIRTPKFLWTHRDPATCSDLCAASSPTREVG